MISFGDALKAFRRGVHVYGPDWRGIVLCETASQRCRAVVEADRIFQASSLVMNYHPAAGKFIADPSGASLLVRRIADRLDTDILRGHEYTHIIWLYETSTELACAIRPLLRSTTLPESKLRIDQAEL